MRLDRDIAFAAKRFGELGVEFCVGEGCDVRVGRGGRCAVLEEGESSCASISEGEGAEGETGSECGARRQNGRSNGNVGRRSR